MINHIKKIVLKVLCVSLWVTSGGVGYYLGSYNEQKRPLNSLAVLYLAAVGPLILFVGGGKFLFESASNVCVLNCELIP